LFTPYLLNNLYGCVEARKEMGLPFGDAEVDEVVEVEVAI